MNAHSPVHFNSVQLGQVTDNSDPDNRGRVKVRLLSTPMEIWASVVTASAGNNYGISFIPKVEEIVVLAFVSPELPLVLGSLWRGSNSRPQEADPQEDHYVIRTPSETVVDFDDSGPSIQLSTRSGYKIRIEEQGGGTITVDQGSQSITLGPDGITVQASGTVTVNAASVKVSCANVTVDAGMSKFSGVVKCDTLITNAVVSSSYTPGAGNIW